MIYKRTDGTTAKQKRIHKIYLKHNVINQNDWKEDIERRKIQFFPALIFNDYNGENKEKGITFLSFIPTKKSFVFFFLCFLYYIYLLRWNLSEAINYNMEN